jgi:nucleotide-binding universal stress UspA family protein
MSMRVVVAVDGSSAADRAIQLAGSIDWPTGTQFRVVMAAEPPEPIISADWVRPSNGDRQQAELEAAASTVLENAARELATTRIDISRRVLRGRAASKIVENATEFRADLIMVGSRGHGTIASMILGSVSAEVVDHAPCPVLVARHSRLTRAVLGLDGSECGRVAEAVVAHWPIFKKVAIDVTTVTNYGLPWTSGLALSAYEPPAAEIAETAEAIIKAGRDTAEAAALRLRERGLRVSARVMKGDAAAELIRTAEADGADLIVVGTHGRTGLQRLWLGSVARNVLMHASCSVLVARGMNERRLAGA